MNLNPARLTIPPLMVPVGSTWFEASYLTLLLAMTRMPWPRVPETPILAAVKMAAEARRRSGVLPRRASPALPGTVASRGRGQSPSP